MLSASSGVLSKMNKILGTRLIFIDFEISLLIMPENFERIFSFNSVSFLKDRIKKLLATEISCVTEKWFMTIRF
jgi:hypothetical protein